MRAVATFYRPFRYAAIIRGMGMGPPLANSNNTALITLIGDNAERVMNAVVTLTIVRPDTAANTVTNVGIPHVGNGVYKLSLPVGATPKIGEGYRALWHIIVQGKVQNIETNFNVLAS